MARRGIKIDLVLVTALATGMAGAMETALVDQGAFDPRLKGLFAAPGVRVELAAVEPVLNSPVAMTIARDGAVWVIEWRPEADFSVKVLRDADADGTLDSSTLFTRDLVLPGGIALRDGWVYLTTGESVVRIRDEGGKPGEREELIRGFKNNGSHHRVSGLVFGPDGRLYVSFGDADAVLENGRGQRLEVLRTGGVLRCRPDGTDMEPFAIGFRNPWGNVCFTEAGDAFHTDNDADGTAGFVYCRLLHLVEGGDYGWRTRPGAVCCTPDPDRAAWNGERPGRLPYLRDIGRGAPTGLCVYEAESFPARFHGILIQPDVFRRLVRGFRVKRDGSSFEVVEEIEILKSDDGIFRPCDAEVGPDGAIYVLNWAKDSPGGSQRSGDGVHGRLYRLSWRGTESEPALPLRPLSAERQEARPLPVNAPWYARTFRASLEGLAHADPAVRRNSALAAARLGGREALEPLLASFNREWPRGDRVLLSGIVAALERLGPGSTIALRERVKSGDEGTAHAAADALASMHDLAAVEALLDAAVSEKNIPGPVRAACFHGLSSFAAPPDPAAVGAWLDRSAAAAPEARAAALEAMALSGPKARTAASPAVAAGVRDTDARVRVAALRAAARIGADVATSDVEAIAADPLRAAGERLEALRVLASPGASPRKNGKPDGLVERLAAFYAATTDSLLKIETLRTIAAIDPQAAAPLAESALGSSSIELGAEALAMLGQREGTALRLARALADGRVPRQLAARAADALRSYRLPEIRQAVDRALKTEWLAGSPAQALERIREAVARLGSAERGKQLWLRPDGAGCSRCHRLAGTGTAVGPDLTRAWETLPLDKVVESILEPSKEIKEGYSSWTVLTHDGRALTGLIVEDTAEEVVLKDSAGEEVRVRAAEIESRVKDGNSLMPEGSASHLSLEELADLLAFLGSRGAQESLEPVR